MANSLMLSWLLLCSVAALAFPGLQDPPAADPCKCEVVNSVTLSQNDCKCKLPGTTAPVPAIDSVTPVFPEGLPEDGVCDKAPCTGDNKCEYKPIEVVVTIAACARKCTGHDDEDLCVRWTRPAFAPAQTVATSGCHNIGANIVYTGPAPSANLSSCGTAQMEDTITFYKKNGNVAAKLTFSFACGACPASQP